MATTGMNLVNSGGGGGITKKYITTATWSANSYYTVSNCPFKPSRFIIFSTNGIGYGGNIDITTDDFDVMSIYKQSNGTEYPYVINNDGFTIQGVQSSSSNYTYYVVMLD